MKSIQCVPLTEASRRLTRVELPPCSFSPFARRGLDSGDGMSIVFERFGRKGMGVDGLEERNYSG